jgi:hypothetical protein
VARRRIKHVRVGRCSVDIHRDSDSREFVVSSVVGGRRDSGYYTEDKSDARGTAAHQARRLRKLPACKEAR